MVLIAGYNKTHRIDRETVLSIPRPVPQGTRHKPIAHGDIVLELERQARVNGIRILSQDYAVSRTGDRLFGYMRIAGDSIGNPSSGGYEYAIGFRNSHNKSMALRFVTGANVIVCSNMMLSGTWTQSRKHTTGLVVEGEIGDVFKSIRDTFSGVDSQIQRLKSTILHRDQVNELAISAARLNAIRSSDILLFLDEVWDSRYEEFRPISKNETTAWGVYNAATQLFHGTGSKSTDRNPISLGLQFQRSNKLAQLFGLVSQAEDLNEEEEQESTLSDQPNQLVLI